MEMLVRCVIINILYFLYEEDAPFLPACQMDLSACVETKHTISPAFSPTMAPGDCLHIKCTVGRMQGIQVICIYSSVDELK